MLSILIAAVLKFSPLIAGALKSPISSLILRALGSHFNHDPLDIPGLAKIIEEFPHSEGLFAAIEKEHGDALRSFLIDKTPPVGSQPPMMEMTIVQKFYYGDQSHGRENKSEPPEGERQD